VAALAAGDATARARSLDLVVRAYFRPVYAHVRTKWNQSPIEAEDSVQAFFAEAFEHESLAAFDPDKSAFRSFLRLCVDRFVSKRRRDARRLKRGGGRAPLSLDFEGAERALPQTEPAELAFDREVSRSVLSIALERLEAKYRDSGREKQLAAFVAVALGDEDEARPTHAELAARHGATVVQVTRWVFAARRDFRALALTVLRELCVTEEEFRDEVRELLGATLR
jgi:hypothetical protein